jgi:hypothetical protein
MPKSEKNKGAWHPNFVNCQLCGSFDNELAGYDAGRF